MIETTMTRGVGLIPSAAHLSSNRSNVSFTVSNNSYRVGIVGATGAVGQELIALLQATMTAVLAVLPEGAAERVIAASGRSRLSRLPIRGSTWQSIVRGRPSEVDYLNGEIVRLGRRLGLPTPCNSHVVDVVHAVERSHNFWRVEELLPPGASERAGAARVGGAR